MMKLAKDSLDLGVIVSDIKASLKFYQETLGMENVGDLEISFGVLHRLKYGNSFFKLIDPKEVPPAKKASTILRFLSLFQADICLRFFTSLS